MAQIIQIRGGTAAQWAATNPVLSAREMGIETDTRQFKFGNGTTAWNSLAYGVGATSSGGLSDAQLLDRANHTGTQPAATISDFVEACQDVIGAMVAAAGGTYNDAGNTITLPGNLTVQDEGATLSSVVNTTNYTGAGVTTTVNGQVATINIPGAGSATITVQEAGGLISAAINAVNFGAGFDITESPAGTANVNLDLSEYAAGGAAGALPVAGGGTGSTTAAAARTALGLATVAATGVASDLTGTLPIARLPDAVNADGTKALFGDGLWKVPAGGGGGGVTNLTFSRDATTVTVLSDTGTDASLPAATSSLAGVMSAAQATQLAGSAPLVPVVENVATGAPYTLVVADSGKVKRVVDAAAQTINITTAFNGLPVIIQWQDGAGTPVLAAGAGVTLNGASSNIVGSAARGAWVLQPVPGTTNSWDVHGSIGDLTAADITDSTTTGRSLLTAASATAARGTLGAAPLDAPVFTTSVTLPADPSSALQAATKQYVDTLLAGLKWKASVVAATTANGALATAFANGQVIDGVTLATGNRILVKDQTTGSENGIYVVQASGAPVRATDADSSAELVSAAVFVEQGTANADKAYTCTNNAITIGTTAITFAAFTSQVGALLASNNLSDLGNASTARVNLLGVGQTALMEQAPAADRLPYYATSTTAALTAFSGGGRNLVNTGGTQDTFPWFSAPNVHSLAAITAAGRAILDDADAAAQRVTLGAAAAAGQAVELGMFCETPVNKTYVLLLKARAAFTITEVTAKTASGTCTVQVTIDGTNVTGGSVSVTSTEASSTATAANAVAVGQTVAVVVSSNATAADLQVDIGGTRTLVQ